MREFPEISPCFPPLQVLVFTSHVQPEERVHRLSVASGVLPSHLDRTRGAVVLSRSGWMHSGATDPQRPAAPGEGVGIQSRRLERAEGRDPPTTPKEMPRRETQPKTKRNTGCLTPRSEVQPHPRPVETGRGSWVKTCYRGLVRGHPLFLNLFPCEAGATWFSAGDEPVSLLPEL